MKSEKHMETTVTVAGRLCHILHRGQGGPVIYWGMFLHWEDELERMWEALTTAVEGAFVLAAFQVEDWNAQLSPWPAPAAFGDADFAGQGSETLQWLIQVFVPYMEQEWLAGESVNGQDPTRERWLMGYSLSGLFALWTAYETDLFSGIICGSGSLWYRGWDTYVQSHGIRNECRIYLSLGKKEEKTRNREMACVGERTRNQAEILERDPKVLQSTLEWNEGGHFADSAQRLAKGLCWMKGADQKSK